MLGYILLGLGLLVAISGGITQLKTKITKSKKVVKEKDGVKLERSDDTDKDPPVGFAKHYQLIIDTAPTADASVRESYALANLNEADILVAERQRLEKLVADKGEIV